MCLCEVNLVLSTLSSSSETAFFNFKRSMFDACSSSCRSCGSITGRRTNFTLRIQHTHSCSLIQHTQLLTHTTYTAAHSYNIHTAAHSYNIHTAAHSYNIHTAAHSYNIHSCSLIQHTQLLTHTTYTAAHSQYM